MIRFTHIIYDCAHALSLARFLTAFADPKEHRIHVDGPRYHGKSYVTELQQLGVSVSLGTSGIPEAGSVTLLHGLFDGPRFSLAEQLIRSGAPVVWVVWGGDKRCLTNQANRQMLNGLAAVVCVPGELDEFPELLVPQINGLIPYFDDTPKVSSETKKLKKIMIGNSGDPSNNHIPLIKKCSALTDAIVYLPIAYNINTPHLQRVAEEIGRSIPHLTVQLQQEMMPLEEFKEHVAESAIVLFAHNRQQAIGATKIAYTSNCKVYMRRMVRLDTGYTKINPGYRTMRDLGYLDIYDVDDLDTIQQEDLDALVESPISNRQASINIHTRPVVQNRFEQLFRICGGSSLLSITKRAV